MTQNTCIRQWILGIKYELRNEGLEDLTLTGLIEATRTRWKN